MIQVLIDTEYAEEIIDHFLTKSFFLEFCADFAVEYTLANILVSAIINKLMILEARTLPSIFKPQGNSLNIFEMQNERGLANDNLRSGNTIRMSVNVYLVSHFPC